jgi:hypothetical protein
MVKVAVDAALLGAIVTVVHGSGLRPPMEAI